MAPGSVRVSSRARALPSSVRACQLLRKVSTIPLEASSSAFFCRNASASMAFLSRSASSWARVRFGTRCRRPASSTSASGNRPTRSTSRSPAASSRWMRSCPLTPARKLSSSSPLAPSGSTPRSIAAPDSGRWRWVIRRRKRCGMNSRNSLRIVSLLGPAAGRSSTTTSTTWLSSPGQRCQQRRSLRSSGRSSSPKRRSANRSSTAATALAAMALNPSVASRRSTPPGKSSLDWAANRSARALLPTPGMPWITTSFPGTTSSRARSSNSPCRATRLWVSAGMFEGDLPAGSFGSGGGG